MTRLASSQQLKMFLFSLHWHIKQFIFWIKYWHIISRNIFSLNKTFCRKWSTYTQTYLSNEPTFLLVCDMEILESFKLYKVDPDFLLINSLSEAMEIWSLILVLFHGKLSSYISTLDLKSQHNPRSLECLCSSHCMDKNYFSSIKVPNSLNNSLNYFFKTSS